MQEQNKRFRDPVLYNAIQLAETIHKTQTKNKQRYEKIRKGNPMFQFELFNPTIPPHSSRDEVAVAEEIMLRQLDKLMDEQEQLDLQLDRLAVKEIEYKRRREHEAQLNMDHYTFLRRQWKKSQSPNNAKQHVERLIHNVGSIKGHINSILRRQNQTNHESEFHQIIATSPEYKSLKKKYEELETISKSQIVPNTPSDTQKKIAELERELEMAKKDNKKLQQENQKLKKGQGQSNGSGKRWIYNYQVKASDDSYLITIQTQNRVSGVPDKSSLPLDELAVHLQGSELKSEAKSQVGNKQISRKMGIDDVFSPRFISRKRMDFGDKFRPMSP